MLACVLCLASCAHPLAETPPEFVLMGEVHDNPDGHRQRLEDLQALVAKGWRPALLMEQFDRERQEDLDRAQQACANAACVVDLAGAKGWDWPLYHPLIEFALQQRLPLVAANVSRADARRIARENFAAGLDPETIADFGLDQPLPEFLYLAQKEAIDAGHCGKLPAAALPGMVSAQVARDVWMSKVMLEHGQRGAVLIAGNAHVRRDIGAGYWLTVRLNASGAQGLRAVGYLESAPGPGFDEVRRIRAHARADPCQAFG